MKDSEIFERAAQIIDELGWCRFFYCNPDSGAVCAEGALQIAHDARRRREQDSMGDWYILVTGSYDRLYKLQREFMARLNAPVTAVEEWNDLVAIDATEVTGAFREHAAWLREQGR